MIWVIVCFIPGLGVSTYYGDDVYTLENERVFQVVKHVDKHSEITALVPIASCHAEKKSIMALRKSK